MHTCMNDFLLLLSVLHVICVFTLVDDTHLPNGMNGTYLSFLKLKIHAFHFGERNVILGRTPIPEKQLHYKR